MNHYYANVECLYNPSIRNKPVVVGGDESQRHGIVLTKNPLAKRYGIKTGEGLWEARKKCPGLVVVPAHYDRYIRFSKLAREIYSRFTDRIEPFGLDLSIV
ncbi:DNA polymerase IV [Ethanoligenens sp.]|uniref:Y-family DNA polymerase n=1 Tax=Ethanoligenens sp. TaxID=2099655 RepID=UPI0039E928A8